mgnify:CR=1 FL=1
MDKIRLTTISIILMLTIIVLAIFFWIANTSGQFQLQQLPGSTEEQDILYPGGTHTQEYPTSAVQLQTETSPPTPDPTGTTASTPTETPTPTPTLAFSGQEVIGYSVLERPLEVYRFGTGEHVHLIVAGIHGGYEWNTVELAYELIELLENEPERVPSDKTLYILPNLNPDGYAKDKGYDGRANANNVDLNRNWDHNWQIDWARSGCWNYRPITGGEYAESEPEVRALKTFILEREVQALISYHSQMAAIFSGNFPFHPPSEDLANKLWAVSSYSYPPPDYGCHYTGQFVDWAADQGIAALDVELRNHVDNDYTINVPILDAFLAWSYPEMVD